MATPTDNLEPDSRFPSGKWHGFWTDPRIKGRPQMELLLTFRAGTIAGEGRDRVGAFIIRGFYAVDDGKCRWTKRYVGQHDVYYQGFNEGRGIWGTWELSEQVVAGVTGGFHIWPEGMGDPTQPALEAAADLPVSAETPVEVGEPVGVR